MTQRYTDRYWHSADGLKLHYRDYPTQNESRVPILCLHGLTRNSRDFATLADRLSPDWRVIVPEMRGRAESAYADDSSTYNPLQYVLDIEALLDDQGIDRFIVIGTSLGGLMTMLFAEKHPGRLVAATLNDIGPVIEESGLDNIRGYVGQSRSFSTWMHAARALEETHKDAHPTYRIDDWLGFAKRTMTLCPNGRISFDYDMAIGDAFKQPDGAAPASDLWGPFEALKDTPLLLIRGAVSNLLSEETVTQMQARHSDMKLVTIADTGHAPTLDEPDAVAAIEALLASVAAEPVTNGGASR